VQRCYTIPLIVYLFGVTALFDDADTGETLPGEQIAYVSWAPAWEATARTRPNVNTDIFLNIQSPS
jgi:hypothetical protein